MILNDSYLPGALTMAYSLRRLGTEADVICLVSEQVSQSACGVLAQVFDHVVPVPSVFTPYKRRQQNQFFPFLFTRFHVLKLGAGGGLGFRYEKVLSLDADMVALRHYDHLFSLSVPAGVLNESKEMLVEHSSDSSHAVSEKTAVTGKWRWHEIYDPVCPHGMPIPKHITDRVLTDTSNMGVNGALVLMEPSSDEFEAILEDIKSAKVLDLISDKFSWPEMQYTTARWSGSWHNIDARFAAIKGFPGTRHVFGLHFAGFKPWRFKQPATMKHYARYDDFQLWFDLFEKMLTAYPDLCAVSNLRRLHQRIVSVRELVGKCDGSR